jgi:hypothetical protein
VSSEPGKELAVPEESAPVYRTKSGRELTEADIEELVAEAERGYDVEKLRKGPEPLAVSWAIIGFPGGAVLATHEMLLGKATRTQEGISRVPIGPGGRGAVARLPVWRYDLNLAFSRYASVNGQTFRQSMQSLFEIWNPPAE